jgi:hypothetical protein
MIPQHNTAVKTNMDSLPGEEADVFEMTRSTEHTETSFFVFKPRDLEDQKKTSGQGIGGNFSYFLLGAHRLGLSLHQTENDIATSKIKKTKQLQL